MESSTQWIPVTGLSRMNRTLEVPPRRRWGRRSRGNGETIWKGLVHAAGTDKSQDLLPVTDADNIHVLLDFLIGKKI